MNQKQKQVIELLKHTILNERQKHATNQYEYKEWEVNVREIELIGRKYEFVYVSCTTGLVGDEGTMASVLCREHRHIHIGKRGAVKLTNAKVKKHSRGIFWVANARTI